MDFEDGKKQTKGKIKGKENKNKGKENEKRLKKGFGRKYIITGNRKINRKYTEACNKQTKKKVRIFKERKY